MEILSQYFIKLKDYFLSIDFRRFILILFIALLLLISYTFGLYQFQSAYSITSIFSSLKNRTNISLQTSTKSSLTKILVLSHFNEDLDWLDLFIGDQIPHIVYTRSNDSLVRYSIQINKGREAVAYLRYIVDHYSSLPSLIAFIHAHRTSWHQKDPPDIVTALRALQWNKYLYMPLSSTMTHAIFQLNTHDPQAGVNYELWRDVLQKELGSPPVNGIRTHCCASFVVKREAILAHPKVFYSNILDYVVASPYSDQLTGRTLEYTWHMIFGQPAHINYKKCDIFICDLRGNVSVQLAEQRQ